MGKIRQTSISIVCILISFILIILSLNREAERFGIVDYGHNLLLLISLCFLSLYILFKSSSQFKIISLDRLAIILAISSLPSLFFDNNRSFESISYGILQFSFIPIGLMFGRAFVSSVLCPRNKNKLIMLFILPAIVIGVLFLLFQTQIDVAEVKDFVFILVIYLPYILFLDNKYIKPPIIIFFLFVISISVKRTAILSVVLFIIILAIKYLGSSKSLFGKLGTMLCLILIFLAVFSVLPQNYTATIDAVQERFTSVEEDGGSGRDVIYSTVIDRISELSIDSILFGNGYDAVSKKLFGHPAHNDVLEIAYNNGIITVILYIIFIILLIRQILKRILLKQQYLVLLFCVLNYLLLSSLNCIITNPLFTFVTMAAIGMALERTDDSNLLNNEKVS